MRDRHQGVRHVNIWELEPALGFRLPVPVARCWLGRVQDGSFSFISGNYLLQQSYKSQPAWPGRRWDRVRIGVSLEKAAE